MSAIRVVLMTAAIALLATVASAQTEPTPKPRATEDYVVGIGDGLRIVVWNEEALSLNVRVRPDRKITLPLINDIVVAGLTPDAIREEITRRLATYVRDPSVTVIVEEIDSYRVYFLGEISRQGEIRFFKPPRLLQAIAAAGGLTEFSKKKITLVREINGVERRLGIDYKQLIAGDKGQENLLLEPDDLLLID